MNKKVAIAITGASGIIYALRLIQILKELKCEVYLVFSEGAIKTLKYEIDVDYARQILSQTDAIFENNDVGCSLASGSFYYDALIVVPCSVNTIGIIHSGIANTLIGRCAVVAMKERRQIVLVPREMPLPPLTLRQLADLSMIGINICIASPAFYWKPSTIEEVIDFVVFKILNIIGIKNDLIPEWNTHS